MVPFAPCDKKNEKIPNPASPTRTAEVGSGLKASTPPGAVLWSVCAAPRRSHPTGKFQPGLAGNRRGWDWPPSAPCLRLELRSHPTGKLQPGFAGNRRGWDWPPSAPCLRLELRSHPTGKFQPGFAGNRRGWDWPPSAPCLRLELRSHPTGKFQPGFAGNRRGWDSNPRTLAGLRFSRPVQ
jgi:hypothetical protein